MRVMSKVKVSRATVKLMSSDDKTFQVDEAVAHDIVKNIFDEPAGSYDSILLPIISSKILAKVIEYCRYHVALHDISAEMHEVAVPEDEIGLWDAEFVKVDHATLFALIHAAHFLNLKSLLDLTCETLRTELGLIRAEQGR